MPWHRRAFAALALVLGLAAPAVAGTERYALDPVHTRIQFGIWHAGFSQALGTLSGATGTLEFDPDDWSSARLEATVPLQRLDLGDAEWNRAALARRLLHAQRWPQARFVSAWIEPLDGPRFIVHGHLTLRGVTRPVALEVRFNALARHPMPPFRRTAGFSATTTLRRQDFGIDAWPSMIGEMVQVRIEAEAVRTRGGPADAPDPDDVTSQPTAPESTPP